MSFDWLSESPWPLLIILFGTIALLALAAALLELARTRAYRRLLEHGEQAEATVLAAKDTGWRTNKRPHIGYELEVRRAGTPPYTARARLMLHRPWSPIPYPPGSVVRVRVDRDRPEHVAIEGATPVLGGALAAGEVAQLLHDGAHVVGGSLYVVNGRRYGSPDEMPPEDRAAFEQAAAALADADWGGLPGHSAGAPPAPSGARERLHALRALLDEGLISAEEYEAKRAAILDQL